MQKRVNLSIAILLFCFSLFFFPIDVSRAKAVREPVWAGTFYPGSASDLEQVIEHYTRRAAPAAVQIPSGKCLRALILPHAGYRYSGFTAAHAASVLRKKQFARVILMGPDHRVGFVNGAISDVSAYETPLGQIRLAQGAETLREGSMLFRAVPASDRQEHSLEVVLPFLQYYMGEFEMIPIVLGSRGDLNGICDAVSPYMDRHTLLVVSSDLSHYLSYDRALQQDKETIRMIMDLEEGKRLSGRKNAACGLMPILVALKMAGREGWKPVFLNYTNSGDTAGSKDKVVGYSAIAFFGDKVMKKKKMTSKAYTKKQGEILIQLARETIAGRIDRPLTNADTLEEELKDNRFQEVRGTFVTLHKDGNLRGCIGTLTPTENVVEGIRRNAINAAFHDHRFPSLSAEELDDIEIEISILTAPQFLEYKDGPDLLTKLRPNIDGVILKKGGARATFLPQVWSQLPEAEDFLNQLCMKAGLPSDAWLTNKLDILTYQVQYFEEQK